MVIIDDFDIQRRYLSFVRYNRRAYAPPRGHSPAGVRLYGTL
jgi:hypothetical protein